MSGARGYVIGDPKSGALEAVTSEPFAVGEYVIVGPPDSGTLGMVVESSIHSIMLSDVANYEDAGKLVEMIRTSTRDKRYVSRISLVGSLASIARGRGEIPAVPPEPGSPVERAGQGALAPVFAPRGAQWARVGSLVRNEETPVCVSLDIAAARHLAILAMTGMGKSNTVSLMAREIAGRGGTVIIFDYHDDYTTLALPGINALSAKVNPRHLSADELADMLDFRSNAERQRGLLDRALTRQVRRAEDFWGALADSIEAAGEAKKSGDVSGRVLDKIAYAKKRLGGVLDAGIGDAVSHLRPARINVLSTSEFSERQANAALSFYLREILDDRKEATISARHGRASDTRFAAPVFVVIEEAHAFVPRSRETAAKYWASRIAREGRKFGVGMCVVSQRPRGLDEDILSQMGSIVAMRMIQPEDRRQIESAAESVGGALASQLGTLNVGEAIVAGQWTRLDAIVRIDEVQEKRAGADQSAVAAWRAEAKKGAAGRAVPGSLVQKDLLLGK